MTCLENSCGKSYSKCQGTNYGAQNEEDEENKYETNQTQY